MALRLVTFLLAAVPAVLSQPLAAQPFQQGTYRYKGSDGLVSGLTVKARPGGQAIDESWNIDLSALFNCRLILNYQDRADVPSSYNQADFLPRTLKSCTWTANECGIAACDASNVIPNPGRFYTRARSEICAVYKTGNGDSVTAPACFKRAPARHAKPLAPVNVHGIRITPNH